MVDITLGRYRIEVPSTTGGIAIELHTNVIKDRVDEGDRGVQNLDPVSNSDTPITVPFVSRIASASSSSNDGGVFSNQK
jgi:hypothetical protein